MKGCTAVFSGKNPDHSKITILYFWMIFIVSGHFLKLSVLDQLDIAYLDSTKLFPQIHHGISHAGSSKILKSRFFIIEWSPIFLTNRLSDIAAYTYTLNWFRNIFTKSFSQPRAAVSQIIWQKNCAEKKEKNV